MLLDTRKISHQKQTMEFSCVAACLSMVTGNSQKSIINEIESDGFEMPFPNNSALRYLCRNNVHMETVNGTYCAGLLANKIYLLSCPSSISPKSAHMVVGIAHEHGMQIFDPADDITSEKIYSSEDFSNGNIPVFSYCLLTDCEIGS